MAYGTQLLTARSDTFISQVIIDFVQRKERECQPQDQTFFFLLDSSSCRNRHWSYYGDYVSEMERHFYVY